MGKYGWDKKKFGKKVYSFYTYKYNKSDAKTHATRERKKGWLCRVSKRKIGSRQYYDLYVRRRA